ncbi:nucleosome assembly protein 1-like 3 [Bolinopsis microptera]|uniref:nucleosome assembly protein 1-like 3 n=1 Tax=Bolinopsis microptera TaxID=2820187 RepID=UPI003078C582
MAGRKKDKRRRKYSSSSSSDSDSSSSSSSSSSGSSSGSSSSSRPRQQTPNVSTPPISQSLDPVSAMFLDTKPEDLIDQIFIILDESEVKDLCPTIIKHMSITDLKEKALSCIRSLDDAGLQSLYVTQDPDPGADEIDKALIQLGLVGNNTSILDRDTSKWRTVQEAPPTVGGLSDNEAGNSGEAAGSDGEKDGSIFEEEAKSLEPPQPDLTKRKLLEDAPPESSDDAELWRALLMKDKQKITRELVSTDVIAKNLSDKPMDFVPQETVVKRRGDELSDHEDESGKSSPRSPKSPDEESQQIGNPPLAVGNPPLAESPGKPKMSYRQRAAAAAAQDEDEDKISAGDLSSGAGSSDSESSSSEEGEISDDDDDKKKNEEGEKKDIKPESDSEEKRSETPERSGSADKNLDEKSDSERDRFSPRKDSESEQNESRTENEKNEDVSKLYAL